MKGWIIWTDTQARYQETGCCRLLKQRPENGRPDALARVVSLYSYAYLRYGFVNEPAYKPSLSNVRHRKNKDKPLA